MAHKLRTRQSRQHFMKAVRATGPHLACSPPCADLALTAVPALWPVTRGPTGAVPTGLSDRDTDKKLHFTACFSRNMDGENCPPTLLLRTSHQIGKQRKTRSDASLLHKKDQSPRNLESPSDWCQSSKPVGAELWFSLICIPSATQDTSTLAYKFLPILIPNSDSRVLARGHRVFL